MEVFQIGYRSKCKAGEVGSVPLRELEQQSSKFSGFLREQVISSLSIKGVELIKTEKKEKKEGRNTFDSF